MRVIVVCLLFAVVVVSGDLYSDIEDIAEAMPVKEIVAITRKYYENYQSFRDYIAFAQMKHNDQKIEEIFKMEEFRDLTEYFKRHGIEFERIVLAWIRASKKWFGQPTEQEPQSVQPRLGFPVSVGNYIAEINSAVANSQVPEVVRDKMETSVDFANYVEAVKDPEFQNLFNRFAMKIFMDNCDNCHPQMRGFFSKVWKKIKDIGFGVSVSIPLGK